MANILAVGIATLDIVNTTDGYPQEDDEVRAISQQIRRGGNSANTLSVLRQLGHQCRWLGCLADDLSSKFITDDFDNLAIDYTGCEVHPSSVTPTSYITVNKQSGSRTIVHYRDLPEMSATTLEKFSIDALDWIHFEGRNVNETKKMLSIVKSTTPAIPVSIEIEKQRDQLERLFDIADIYFFSKAFATAENFQDAQSLLRHFRSLIPNALLVCTWGQDGAYALEDEQLYYSSAPSVNAVDTIGAGDSFNAGFIHAQLKGETTIKSLEFACELAAKKCTIQGFNGLI